MVIGPQTPSSQEVNKNRDAISRPFSCSIYQNGSKGKHTQVIKTQAQIDNVRPWTNSKTTTHSKLIYLVLMPKGTVVLFDFVYLIQQSIRLIFSALEPGAAPTQRRLQTGSMGPERPSCTPGSPCGIVGNVVLLPSFPPCSISST